MGQFHMPSIDHILAICTTDELLFSCCVRLFSGIDVGCLVLRPSFLSISSILIRRYWFDMFMPWALLKLQAVCFIDHGTGVVDLWGNFCCIIGQDSTGILFFIFRLVTFGGWHKRGNDFPAWPYMGFFSVKKTALLANLVASDPYCVKYKLRDNLVLVISMREWRQV